LPLTKTGNPAARIIRVVTNTNGRINGFVIYLEGYADRWIGKILSKRNKNNVYKRFLDHVGPPAGCICTVLLPNPNPPAKPKRSERKTLKNWPVKAMAFVYPGTTQPTDKDVEDWYTSIFYPAFHTVLEDELQENQWPHLPEGETKLVTSWLQVLPKEDFDWVYLKHADLNQTGMGQFKWISQKKEHLYSVYPVGEVPMKILKNLKSEMLEPADAA
jgi:hypothetical protein